MSIPPKSSLVERLVQDRLRSGDLEASAAQLLNLASPPPVEAAPPPGPRPLGMILGEPARADATPPNGALPNGHRPPAPSPATISLGSPAFSAAEPPAAPPAMVAPAPIGLELRALAEPAPEPAPASPFPLSGLAPSALVPPPAAGLRASQAPAGTDTAVLDPPAEPSKLHAEPIAAPSPDATAPAGGPAEPGRSDMLQGPPTIDAVALERGGMVDWSRTRSRISEEFRLVQRQILRAAFGPGAEPGFSNLLMVTSARPGEGKSFTSVNLAGSIARQGDHHVLLVDADSKRDSFCYALGLAEMRGLLDLVANPKLDPSPLIVKTPIDRLSGAIQRCVE